MRAKAAVRAGPILKWAGGKGQLLAELLARVPRQVGVYHEPFVGGGALFFSLWSLGRVQRAVLSDVNPDLIGTYSTVRSEIEAVIRILRRHRHTKEHYYRVRALDPARLSPAGRAARLIYLNKTCYNGLYRVNSSGRFNVPYGDQAGATICDEDGLRSAAAALGAAELHRESFEMVLDRAEAGDFVYFDPPYQPLSKTAYFTAYSRDRFGEEDQRRLRDVFAALDRRGVQVLLSNSDAPLIRELYAGFRIEVVRASRKINSKSDRRGKISELLISGNSAG